MANLSGWHLIIVLAVVLLLFGAPKLPGLAKSIGQSMRIFRSEVKTMKDENAEPGAAESTAEATPAPAATAAPAAESPAPAADANGSTQPKP